MDFNDTYYVNSPPLVTEKKKRASFSVNESSKLESPTVERVSNKLGDNLMNESLRPIEKEESRPRRSRRLTGSDSLLSYKELSLKIKMTSSFFRKLEAKKTKNKEN